MQGYIFSEWVLYAILLVIQWRSDRVSPIFMDQTSFTWCSRKGINCECLWNVASSVVLKTEHLLPLFESHTYLYICMKDRINSSYFKQWLQSGLTNLVRPLFRISYWWFYFPLLLTSPKGVEELEWPIPFPIHKRLWNKYLTGHKTSFEIQDTFPSSPNYKAMDPCLFEKGKKKYFDYSREEQCQKLALFRNACSEEVM